jgi:hypothetical protein
MEEMEATHTRDNQHSDVYAESDDLRLLKNARLQPIQWIDISLEQTGIPTGNFSSWQCSLQKLIEDQCRPVVRKAN